MITKKNRVCFVLALITIVFALDFAVAAQGFPGGHQQALGPRYETTNSLQALSIRPPAGLDTIHRWNAIALNATGLDHTPVAPGEHRIFGEQLGPGRSSRAMAIVHISIFDVLNAIVGGYKSYTGIGPAPGNTSSDAAIAQAAHDTLSALYPSQKKSFDELLAEDLNRIPEGASKLRGIHLGEKEARTLLALRNSDGSQRPEPRVGIDFICSNRPGKWRKDPISQIPIALGAYWTMVEPFVMRSSSQFRVPPPPALDSEEYAAAFKEAQIFGGNGITTPTVRTGEETRIAVFWAYDGTPSLCAPPRLYNQITIKIADQEGTNGIELARLLALVNTAMADAAIAVWDSKYHYQFWRPITGIREADKGTGPTGEGDGNPRTHGNTSFAPFGAPASNLQGPNFTPPFPAYPSGHAGFGGALFETLRKFYRTDNIAFTFVSDEFNGMTKDHHGRTRPLIPRSFSSLSQAEEENGQSRIYLGIHWKFDKTEGIAQGRRVADYVFKKAFVPIP